MFLEMLKIVLPFLLGIYASYFLMKKEWRRRENDHRLLGLAIIDSLLSDVRNGLDVIGEFQARGKKGIATLPNNSWKGVDTIPNEVLIEVVRVSSAIPHRDYHPRDIRTHCNNYFTDTCKDWCLDGRSKTMSELGKAVATAKEQAEGVRKMLLEVRSLLIDSTEVGASFEVGADPKTT